MTKEQIHELLKGYIVTVRNGKAVVCLGYITDETNCLIYSPEAQAKVEDICKSNNLSYIVKHGTEYGMKIVRMYIDL